MGFFLNITQTQFVCLLFMFQALMCLRAFLCTTMGVCARFQPLALKNVFLNAKDGGAKLLIF